MWFILRGAINYLWGKQSIRQAASPWGHNLRNIKKIELYTFSSTLHTHAPIRARTYIHIYTHAHAHTHTYTHTYTRTRE